MQFDWRKTADIFRLKNRDKASRPEDDDDDDDDQGPKPSATADIGWTFFRTQRVTQLSPA